MRYLIALAVLGLLASPGLLADDEVRKDASGTKAVKVEEDAGHVFKASTLIGMNVRNLDGEELGEIEDVVIDVKTGKVRYVAMQHGGFLDIGDKLFAIPLTALTLEHEDDDHYLVLNRSKEFFQTAEGFNKDRWPTHANKQFLDEVERTAREPERDRTEQ